MKTTIGKKSKVEIQWNVIPSNYSLEKAETIRAEMAKKYGIPKDNITVTPNFIKLNDNGEVVALSNEVIDNIQDPKFQQNLFLKYFEENGITEYNFDEICKIDNHINSLIDYEIYDAHRRYEIKWIKWSNFLSYGENNFFDFTQLSGLVLLNGEPANQSGKSTFAYDLLHFLLFGKTNSGKADVFSDIFNRYSPEATEVKVEGCLTIEGNDYVIKRTLTRPALSKRTEKSKVTHKVEYYRLIDGIEQSLIDDESPENLEGTGNVDTNKIIKEAIGNEKDFDLVICANSDNLKSLISLKDTDRGRLLTKWIGLLVIEDKEKIAREKWNKEVSKNLYSYTYNRGTLQKEVEDYGAELKVKEEDLNKWVEYSNNVANIIATHMSSKEALLLAKQPIDDNLTRIDVTTVETKIQSITDEGKKRAAQKERIEAQLKEIGDVSFNNEIYVGLVNESKKLNSEMAVLRTEIKNLKERNQELRKSEYCPTCGKKLDNVSFDVTIAANEESIKQKTELGINKSVALKNVDEEIGKMETQREQFMTKNNLEVQRDKIEVELRRLRLELQEQKRTLADLERNKEIIKKNGEIDAQINVINHNIKIEESNHTQSIMTIENLKRDIKTYETEINNRKVVIEAIEKEEVLVQSWGLYLQLIGKNGISKMVLRNTLPIINGEMKRLLNDVCDFDVEVVIDDRNDVAFNLIRDNVVTKLSSGSGFEQTAASLALRVVLGNMSTLSRPSFILLDEVLGGVAKENYDNIKKLYDRILKDYSFVFQITHLDDIVDWHDKVVTVKKVNNISSITVENKSVKQVI
jgi:DNA repair exonuclease SbcCD ATPase subunit